MGPGALDAEDTDAISPSAKRKFAEAVRSLEEGQQLQVVDWDALAVKFQAVVDDDLRHAEAHYNLGVIAERRGKVEEAEGHYLAAIEQKEGLAQAWENLGLVRERLGDERGAEGAYKALLQARPEHAGARARLADLHLRSGNAKRAKELAREALLRDPKNLPALGVSVRAHLALGEVEVAKLVALRASQVDEAAPDGPYLLGRIFEHEGRKGAAALQHQKAAALAPFHVPSRARLARIALDQRDYDEAERLYEELVRLQPAGFEPRLNLGLARLGKGDFGGAMEALEQAQALAPNDVRPSYPIARILHRHGDEPERALEHYRRYVSGAPIHLRRDHPVFQDLRECEQLVQFLAQARAEEEAARRREEARAAAEAAEAAEAAAAGEPGGAGDDEAGEAGTVPAAATPSSRRGAPAKQETDPDLILPEGFDPAEPSDDF
jgi:tetratricopeptide (TPR) repeat protein